MRDSCVLVLSHVYKSYPVLINNTQIPRRTAEKEIQVSEASCLPNTFHTLLIAWCSGGPWPSLVHTCDLSVTQDLKTISPTLVIQILDITLLPTSANFMHIHTAEQWRKLRTEYGSGEHPHYKVRKTPVCPSLNDLAHLGNTEEAQIKRRTGHVGACLNPLENIVNPQGEIKET